MNINPSQPIGYYMYHQLER